jgi:hypothetical protein
MNAELQRTRDQLVAKRDAYNAAIGAINELIRVEDGAAAILDGAGLPTARRSKAPNGALPAAILDVLKSPMTNMDLRTALEGAKYPYSVSPELIRMACVKLKRAKEITATTEGGVTKYEKRPKK